MIFWFWACRGPDLVVIRSERDGPPPVDDLPHVVLILGCTVRKDQTSLHGGPSAVTPNLSRLAAEGTVFDDVVAAAPWTRAASAALLTGRHPLRLGLADVGPGRDDFGLADDAVLLAERLGEVGYATVGLTTNPNLNAVYGFDQGFDGYVQPRSLWRKDNAKVRGDSAIPTLMREVEAVAASGRPVFVQSMWIDAHSPYQASAAAAAQFAEPGLPSVVAEYRVALHRLDDLVGMLLDGLWEAGLDPARTLVVFASDHGEGLNHPAHHGKAHGRSLSPSAVEAVWLMRGPGVPAGRRVSGVASQVDLVPTLIGLLGLRPDDQDGMDLSAAVRGERSATGRPAAFTDTWFQDVDLAAVWTDDWACQRRFSGKRAGTTPDGCFDRRRDPEHTVPMPLGSQSEVIGLWRADAGADATAGKEVVPGEADAEALRALGYAD